jgi:hypothetical protein
MPKWIASVKFSFLGTNNIHGNKLSETKKSFLSKMVLLVTNGFLHLNIYKGKCLDVSKINVMSWFQKKKSFFRK